MASESFDWLTLTEGESILWSGQPRRKSILKWAAIALAVPIVAGVVADAVIGLLAGLVSLLVLAWLYLWIVNTDYVLTDRAVYRKRGVLGESVQRVPLRKVQNTDLSKGVFGAQFGYGTVEVSSAGSGGTDLRIAEIYDPEEVRSLLEEHAKRAEGAGRASTGSADPESVERALAEARELRKVAESLEETFSGGNA